MPVTSKQNLFNRHMPKLLYLCRLSILLHCFDLFDIIAFQVINQIISQFVLHIKPKDYNMLKTIFLFPFRQTLCWTAVKWKITIRSHPSLIKPFPQKHLDIVGFIPACFPYDYRMVFAPNHGQLVRRVKDPRYFIKGQAETTGFYPTNQNIL